jgi:CBS domain-containing protein
MTTVRDLLQHKGNNVLTIGADDSVREAARRMNEARVGALVVIDPRGMIGIFTERDILIRIVAESRPPDTTCIREVMSSQVAYCTPEMSTAECQQLMSRRHMRHLPVLQDGQLIGLISTGDIMAHEVTQQQVTIEYMHEYIHGRT